MTDLRAAIYARVSSEHQARAQTIASQVAALRERVAAEGLRLVDDLVFVDDGFSGASLVRPALERLRDLAAAGGIERLYVQAPDRLARRYAYQVLLIDELQRAGVELVFLNRTLSQTPEDELLLQVQGMVAEYERAKILERGRRGRRHSAQAGAVSVLGHAPYGYRYITKAEGGGQARYEVVLEQARVVRQVFEWVGRERASLAEAARRLMAAGVPTATGRLTWDRSQIWTMLRNPAYQGMAAFGKTRMGPLRPRLRGLRGHPLQPRRPGSAYATPPDAWIGIPVPTLVSPDLFAAAQEQLRDNRRRAKREQRGSQFLVQGLAVCARCGYAYCGARSGGRRAGEGHRAYGYYRCTGTDRFRFGGQAVCDNPQTRGDLLDEAVWAEIRALLEDPARLRAEYQRRLLAADQAPDQDATLLEGQIRRVRQGIGRLIDGYADGLIDKPEFEPRVSRLKERVAALERQLQEARETVAQQRDLRLIIGHLDAFAAAVAQNLEHLDWSGRRAVVRALVKQVEVDYDEVRVVFRVGPGPVVLDSAPNIPQDCGGRRSAGPAARPSRRRRAHEDRSVAATVPDGPGEGASIGWPASSDASRCGHRGGHRGRTRPLAAPPGVACCDGHGELPAAAPARRRYAEGTSTPSTGSGAREGEGRPRSRRSADQRSCAGSCCASGANADGSLGSARYVRSCTDRSARRRQR
jgi:site-specific DNA recombinase